MYLTVVTLRIARDNVRAHLPDALDLAASGTVAPERVVSHILHWEQLPDALPEKHLKPVFVRDTTPPPDHTLTRTALRDDAHREA
jgi:hypothetical protein